MDSPIRSCRNTRRLWRTAVVTRMVLFAAAVGYPGLEAVSIGAEPLTPSKPFLDLEGVEGQLTELQPGRLFTVRLTFPQGFELPSGRSPEMRLNSNVPQFPVIRVPIIRTPAPAAPARPTG